MLKIKKILFSRSESTHDELLLIFKEQYLEERDFVRSSIYWMVNINDVDDLVQEAFLKGWKNFKKFNGKSSFKTWIYRIAMNVAYDYLKKSQKMQKRDDSFIDTSDSSFETSDLISKGVMLLSIEQRESFILHYQMGMTYLEISQLQGIPEGTVKSRTNAAKNIFIKFLKKNGYRYE